jgi:hypothetical protein
MKVKHLTSVLFTCLVLIVSSTAFAETNGEFSYDNYAAVLKKHVNEEGVVDYKGLKENREKLDDFAAELATLKLETFEAWTDAQKVALWINAYNALTLQAIINHYPIKPRLFGGLLYPDNSIRQIPGVWDRVTFPVMGTKVTLDGIEHDTLRAKFNEPRIHMALVCAAMGCPPLRREPYRGDDLDAQLDDQTRRFLKNPKQFRIEPIEGRVYLSSIFKWFGQDFVKTYGTDENLKGHSERERAVLNFISKYADNKIADFLRTSDYEIGYLDYDWSLNEQKDENG